MTASIPFPRILLGPGPSGVTPGVLEALGQDPIGYLDPELFTLLDALRSNLRTVFGTTHEFTVPLTGTGMAGMEACLANILAPGDRAVIGVNGFFGGRMVEIARRHGADVLPVEVEWGRPIEASDIVRALQQHTGSRLVACVHAETSTGVETALEPIAQAAHDHGAIFLADAVTSLGGIPVELSRCGVDVCYSGTQKCVGAPPGLSPISVSDAVMAAAAGRTASRAPWYYDWSLLRNYYDPPHAYHHTVPVNLYRALHQALAEILHEGLEPRYKRHRDVSALLLAELRDLGILPFAPEGHRLPTLNAVLVPDSVSDEAAVRGRLLTEYGIEIGGGLGQLKGRVWRIGTMGASATERNVLLLVAALRKVLGH